MISKECDSNLNDLSVTEFMHIINSRNIKLWMDGESLKYKAPKGAVTDEILAYIRQRKEEIISGILIENAKRLLYEPIEKVDEREFYPLSNAQRRMYLLYKLETESTAYNITNVLKIEGNCSKEKMESTFMEIVKRHESLRTSFKIVDGEPVQRINRSIDFKIEYGEIDDDRDIEDLTREFVRPFNLACSPLFRLKLLKLDENRFYLLFDIHHIISDGVSASIFVKEFNCLYNDKKLEPINIQYKDYSAWHEKLLNSELVKKQREYWLKAFEGELPVLALPVDYKRPAEYSFEGDSIRFNIGKEITLQLNSLARKNRATLYTVLLSAYYILLSKYTGQDDIIIGSPVAGRRHSDVYSTIGMFVNTIPLRNYPDQHKTYKEFLHEVTGNVLSTFDNQDYSLERLMEDLNVERDPSRNPLFDTVFVLQNMNIDDVQADGLGIEIFEYNQKTAQFDITVRATEKKDGMEIEINYCTSLFSKETINRLSTHFTNILEHIIKNPECEISEIELMSDEEIQQLLKEFNNTSANYPMTATIHGIFEEQVKKTPDNIAVSFEGNCMTYRELNAKANRLARTIREYVTQDSDKNPKIAAILLERSSDIIVAALGALKAGCGYLPIDPGYPSERINYMLEDSGTGILITKEEFIKKNNFQGRTIHMDDKSIYKGEDTNLENTVKPDSLAYIIYTSGTTGKPKGVMIEHRNVVRLLFNDRNLFDFNDKDVWTMFHSFCFDFSVWEIYGALLYGGKLVVVPKSIAREPKDYLELLKAEKVTVLNQTPTSFSNLIEYEIESKEKALALRYVIFGGEALKPAVLKPWKEKYSAIKLINMYGITETTVHVTYKEITDYEIETNISNIGRPIPTLSVYIMDSESKLVPIGVPGELCVGGDGVGPGYLNRPELTREKFIPNPYIPLQRLYKSGDLARFLPNGEIEYLGRIDHQVKIRGHRIELGEIESKLLRHPEIKEAVVIARENRGQNNISAYIVSGQKLKSEEIRGFLAEELPDYMIPAYLFYLDKIPLTSNGKIDRKALPVIDGNFDTGEEYVAPGNEIEEKMAVVWQKVLGLDKVGTNQNFFTLGGDSIKAVKLVSRMNSALGTNIKMKDIYLNQNIKELSANISITSEGWEDELKNGIAIIDEIKSSILNSTEESGKLPADTEDFYPLSQIQQGMVYYSKLRPEEPIYHDQFPYLIKFKGFNEDKYQEAVKLVVKRHTILRTTFDLEKFAQPLQIVHKDMLPVIKIEDISRVSVIEQQSHIKAYMIADLKNKFKFKDDLLWRMGMFKLDRDNYCILLSFQHAVLDGWSVAALMTEIMAYYSKLLKGETVENLPLKCSYKDYVAINLSRKANKSTQKFWNDLLKGYTRTKLPFNISGKRLNKDTENKILKKSFNSELLNRLQEKAKKYQCTLKEICLSAYLYLMGVITTENDIVTGVVTHERPALEDSENILGCFLNSVPLRLKVEKEIDKLDLLNKVKDYEKNVKAHELFLGDISNIIGEVNNNGNPVFDTLFNFTDFHVMEDIMNTEFAARSYYELDLKSAEMTNTLFDLEVSKTLDNFEMQIKYSSAFFQSEDIETAAGLYERILEKFSSDDKVIVGEDLLTNEELKEILFSSNNTKVKYDSYKKIHELFEEQAQKSPESIALISDGRTLTYGKLDEYSNRLSHQLISKGVKSGDHVALISQRNFEMIIGMLGILKAGGAYVPIDPDYPTSRKEYIVSNSDVSAVVTDMDYDFPHKNTVIINYGDMELYPAYRPDISIDSSQLAYVIYTSGSTGSPKGVMIEHHSAVNLISWVNREFNVSKNDRLLFITSMCFDLSVYDIFGILAAGGSVVVAKKEQVQNPSDLKNLVKTERITFWDSVPSTMNYLINSLEGDDEGFIQNDLRLVFMSGDWIPVKLPYKIKEYFPNARPISLGGATEGTVWSIYYPIEEVNEYQTSIPYGKPIDNNYFYILDEAGRVVPRGVAGELYIGGVGVARGYMNDEKRTAASFVDNKFLDAGNHKMYKTGDLGRMMPDGNIEFLGRTDHQVKIRGFRVELGEIENQLLKHGEIKEAVVTDRVDNSGNKYLAAYFVASRGLSGSELREYLHSKLPEYMIPTYFVPLEKIPLTQNGKIDRKAVPDPVTSVTSGQEYEAPQNEVEIKLVEIWKEVLDIDRVGVNDNFFELGGHSLKATAVVTKIHKAFNVEIPLAKIFGSPTIKQLSNYIISAKVSIYSSIKPVPKREYYELSSAQKRVYIVENLKKSGEKTDGDTSYNVSSAVIAEGEIDVNKLQEVCREIVSRHEVFRTSFEIVDGRPVQRISDYVDFSINIDNFEDIEENEININKLTDNFIRPFDLSKAPLFRVNVVKIGAEKHLLIFDMHHIISDGVSMGILLKEFNSLYGGHKLQLPRIQYKDFAQWQNNILKTEVMKKQEDYWLSLFSDGIPSLDIPTDYPRPEIKTFEGAEFKFGFDSSIAEKLSRLASETGTTMYMVLLSAFYVLLHKITGKEEMVVGTSVAGRPHSDLENVVGMFVNMLAMRNKPKADITYYDFLADVRENALKAFENQNYQFEKLVDKLGLERNSDRNPLFDVAFVLQNTGLGNMEASNVKFAPFIMESKISKFDLTLYSWETDEGIDFIIEYSTALFKRESIEEMSRQFIRIIKSITENKLIKIKDIAFYDEEKASSIIEEINKNRRDIVIDIDF
ncbi:non-ribosomal peptide synthetase [Ruminiclostridium papyrosolvens]|uniref:Carrier domain-containing protein n=1 Tax=Ruminiclostridium papyrosolvens C7 TaxID=1330534 RepID=U4R3N6_9FIRM|nr:non-ribosomal peptide synthetase [Ruminiclostridium papyrosolvens]EPR13013.1 hypothetical protein L323_06530 [Ruminiclostridium papyrosolvens C7]